MDYHNSNYVRSLVAKLPETEPADSHNRCVLQVMSHVPNNLLPAFNTFLSGKPSLAEILHWFSENIPHLQDHYHHYTTRNIFSATSNLINLYELNLPHSSLPAYCEAKFVSKLFYKHYYAQDYLDNSPQKTLQLYQLFLTQPPYTVIVDWFKNNISDWKSEYSIFQSTHTILSTTDNFIHNFKTTVCSKTDAGSDENKVVFLYNHFRNLLDGYLSYSSKIHVSFYDLVRTNPSPKKIIDWFRTNVGEWNSSSYGLTNGRIDWHTGGCFADTTRLLMADGSTKQIQYIRKGDMLQCGQEIGTVLCVLQWTMPMECVTVGNLVITPWHPIRLEGEWVFPYHKTENGRGVKRTVYNLVLDSGHVVIADGIEACTLGHGFTDNKVIEHAFYGTLAVIEELQRIDPEGWQRGVVRGSGVMIEDGMVVGMV